MPDFIIIGTQRGGTTSLYNYLSEHPSVSPASMKEVHFFENNFEKGLPWYRAQFPLTFQKHFAKTIRRQDFVTGEASPYYLFHPHVPKRAAAMVPHVKLIVLLRNPVDRAYSQYFHGIEMGYEHLSFEEALAQEETRTHEEEGHILTNEQYYSHNHQYYTYRARGLYVDQLQRWMDFFPREQFLIIKSEDFYANPDAVFSQTLAFLNLSQPSKQGKKAYKLYNNSKYLQTGLDPHLRKQLVTYYEPHNARLYKFLGRNFDWDN
ncbi:MAG: sulfotransferase domain-containing protein [Ktedonobacteraceae bacterium]|nr:sulfotransferase domain-containing protein [Ktedonobacteraceae bacterium]